MGHYSQQLKLYIYTRYRIILRQTVTTPVKNVIYIELQIYSFLYKSSYISLQQKLFHAKLMCHFLTQSSPNL